MHHFSLTQEIVGQPQRAPAVARDAVVPMPDGTHRSYTTAGCVAAQQCPCDNSCCDVTITGDYHLGATRTTENTHCDVTAMGDYIHVFPVTRASASNRERKRMQSINSAFEQLRAHVPTFPFEQRLSKIDTLRLAISYIQLLRDVLCSDKNMAEFIASGLQQPSDGAAAGGGTGDVTWNTSGNFFCTCSAVFVNHLSELHSNFAATSCDSVFGKTIRFGDLFYRSVCASVLD